MDRRAALPPRAQLLHAAARARGAAARHLRRLAAQRHRSAGSSPASLFVLPGFVAIMALSVLYAGWGDTLAVEALFAGVAPAVLAIVAHAVVRLSKRRSPTAPSSASPSPRSPRSPSSPSPSRIVLARRRRRRVPGRTIPARRVRARDHGDADVDASPPLIADDALHGERRRCAAPLGGAASGSRSGAARVVLACVAVGGSSIFVEEGTFFGGTALVTFGGAYAVLGYVAQRAVETYGWLGARRHDHRSGHGRDDARSAHHGRAVRRLHGRLQRPGRPQPVGRRRRRPRRS